MPGDVGWGSQNTTTKHGQICFPLHFFTSSPDDTKHGIPLRKAPCSGPTHRQFSASPPKPATCNKPSRKASFHALPNARPLPWHHQRDKPRAPTTALNQSSKEPGRILTGSGLGHGPAAWHRLDPPSHSASFISSYFFRSPPPRALPTLSFSIQPQSSSQQLKHCWPDTRAKHVSREQLWRLPTTVVAEQRPSQLFTAVSLPLLKKLLVLPLLQKRERTLTRSYAITKLLHVLNKKDFFC